MKRIAVTCIFAVIIITPLTACAATSGHYQAAAPAAALAVNTSVGRSDIGEAKAKEIALEHAGLKETDVRFIRVHLDVDDGRRKYEVEFYKGDVEYDYDIAADTGEILSYGRETKRYAPPPAAFANDIGAAKAKEIALKHAGYRENEVRRLRAERDYDGRTLEYEVKFYVGTIKYSYEIDAGSGEVLHYEAEKED